MKSGTSRTERIAIEKADALFQIRRIGEIQVIEKATFEQIEAKRRELKELVGASYKDVLVSADAILEMSQHSNDILNNLCRIQNQLKSSSSIKSHGSKRNATDERLHAMASRVKCLLDVQEMVWNALDAGDYLEAARRYQRGELVMDQLMNHVKTAVLKRFPFVEHLWPTLLQLKPQILDQVRRHLIENVDLERSDVKICLLAVFSLETMSTVELLETYLQCSKLNVLNLSTNFSSTEPSKTLCQIGKQVQNTMIHILHLFLRHEETTSELRQAIGEDAVGFQRRLLGELSEPSEQELWESQRMELRDRLEDISESNVTQTLKEWLEQVAQTLRDFGESLLLSCIDLKSLSKIESTVKEALRSTEWETSMARSGIEIDLWKTVFESTLQEKCLSIVAQAFNKTVSELKANLDVLMDEIVAIDLDNKGNPSTTESKSQNDRSKAQSVVKTFDSKLSTILNELVEILGSKGDRDRGDHSPTASVRHGSVHSFSLLSGTHHRGYLPKRGERSIELEPKIQTLWETTVLQLAKELDQKITDLSESSEIQRVQFALLIGTVAFGLMENCPSMGTLFGPMEEWQADLVPRSTRSSIKAETTAPPHLGNAFQKVAFHGLQIWIDWAMDGLTSTWDKNVQFGKLTGDENLQEITILHQATEETSEGEQMQFRIPSAPSEATMQLLMNVSLELQRLGIYALQPQIVHLFQFKLENKICSLLQKRIKQQESAWKENYVLQLLMDFRFVCDICSAGEPVPKRDTSIDVFQRSLSTVPEEALSFYESNPKTDPSIQKAVQESRQLSKALETELSNILDPIDWATYEPHLWKAEARWYCRTSVLFGCIGSTMQNLHSDTSVKLPLGSETNCFHAAPISSRFQYLPVRPALLPDKTSRAAASVNYASLVEPEEDPESDYSFSDFDQIAMRSEPRASESKTNAGSISSLGTMFSDKAAEMSAMAQQRFEQFGDYLQPSSLTTSSLFSSFTKRT